MGIYSESRVERTSFYRVISAQVRALAAGGFTTTGLQLMMCETGKQKVSFSDWLSWQKARAHVLPVVRFLDFLQQSRNMRVRVTLTRNYRRRSVQVSLWNLCRRSVYTSEQIYLPLIWGKHKMAAEEEQKTSAHRVERRAGMKVESWVFVSWVPSTVRTSSASRLCRFSSGFRCAATVIKIFLKSWHSTYIWSIDLQHLESWDSFGHYFFCRLCRWPEIWLQNQERQ